MFKIAKRFSAPFLLLLFSILFSSAQAAQSGRAQPTAIQDIAIMNLSNTPTSSVDPFLIVDRTGVAHLFWSEDVGGRVVMGGTTAGNTIMHARWDGASWSRPNDILLTPSTVGTLTDQKAWQPEATIDKNGFIHLIWLGQYPDKLYYSNAFASDAHQAQSWSSPATLSENTTGTQYSIDIEYLPANDTLHIVFARGHWEEQFAGDDPRAITYLTSSDKGKTWSEPVDIALTPDPQRGYSNVRLLSVPEERLFVSWTEWDQTGNGQEVWVARSLDSGISWDPPVKLAERAEDEYERDWAKLAWLGGNQLVATWEGGYRAYRHFMYSDDNGLTWSDADDTFYWLIGENGFVEFARDGSDNLHLFVAQRIREGTIGRTGGEGLWYSTWMGGGEWSDTRLLGGINPMVNPRVVITGGNRVVAAWYSNNAGEIIVLTGNIIGVPASAMQPYESATIMGNNHPDSGNSLPSGTIANVSPLPSPSNSSEILLTGNLLNAHSSNQGFSIWIGLIPAVLLLGVFISGRFYLRGRQKISSSRSLTSAEKVNF